MMCLCSRGDNNETNDDTKPNNRYTCLRLVRVYDQCVPMNGWRIKFRQMSILYQCKQTYALLYKSAAVICSLMKLNPLHTLLFTSVLPSVVAAKGKKGIKIEELSNNINIGCTH